MTEKKKKQRQDRSDKIAFISIIVMLFLLVVGMLLHEYLLPQSQSRQVEAILHEEPPQSQSRRSESLPTYKDPYLAEKMRERPRSAFARRHAQSYIDMLATTKDTVFSRIYFDALLAGQREPVAKIYAREIVAGKSRKYINAYISGLDFKKMSEKYSRAYAQQIADGKGIDYAELYAQAINEGHSNAQAEGIAKKEIADRAQRLRAQREAEAAQEARRKAQKAQDDRAYWTFYNAAYRTEIQKGASRDYATLYAMYYALFRTDDGMNHYAASAKAHKDLRSLLTPIQRKTP